jgi:hypothetical protein
VSMWENDLECTQLRFSNAGSDSAALMLSS